MSKVNQLQEWCPMTSKWWAAIKLNNCILKLHFHASRIIYKTKGKVWILATGLNCLHTLMANSTLQSPKWLASANDTAAHNTTIRCPTSKHMVQCSKQTYHSPNQPLVHSYSRWRVPTGKPLNIIEAGSLAYRLDAFAIMQPSVRNMTKTVTWNHRWTNYFTGTLMEHM